MTASGPPIPYNSTRPILVSLLSALALAAYPRNNVLNDMRHWWSVKMLITSRLSPDCCKQVIAWRVSSPGTNPRTGSQPVILTSG